MRPSFFVTTPIFYVNDVPHIGHAYTVIAADVLARYRRMTGHDVLFLTGTDEHGQKIEKAAAARGESAQEMTDRLSARFATMWQTLNISNDQFVRTTEARHRTAVHALFNKLKAAGDIYEDQYKGAYCVPCESFWTELQLDDGNCPDCARPVEEVEESSYFFRMSRFGEALLQHINDHPDFITPKSRRNEVARFIEGGLRDLSVSRTGVKWGIDVPDGPGHVIYVWLDALVNYLTAVGYPDDRYKDRWPAQVHIIGKDILRFHGVYWPSFLLSAGIDLPEKIVSHGWWTIDGEKMSKSRGNVVDPGAVVAHFGADPLRYFLLREVPFGQDGNFSVPQLLSRTNTELANDLGNLLSRVVSMVHRYRDGVVPTPSATTDDETVLITIFDAIPAQVETAMSGCAFDKALAAIWTGVTEANRYVDRCAPWSLAKQDHDERLDTVLYSALEALRLLAIQLYPTMPDCARRMWTQLGLQLDPNQIDLATSLKWGGLPSGATLPGAVALFPRLDPDQIPASLTPSNTKEPTVTTDNAAQQPATTTAPVAPAAAASEATAPEDDFISIHDFAKVRLQVGKVVEAEVIKKSKKLLKLQVDIGTETRQVVAGIARKYSPEEIVGKQVVVVTNLRPAKLMGETSEGMILAAGDSEVTALLTPTEPVETGARIK